METLSDPARAPLDAGQRRSRPRYGHIDFLNCLPLHWGLARTGALLDLDPTFDTPDRLGAALADGALDIGAISLVEFLRHADRLVALPDLAIGSDGPVMSCLLVSKLPLERLDGERVALSSTSRTTVKLAQLLLAERFGVRPEYVVRTADLDEMLRTASAAVVIGDPALRAGLPGPLPTAAVREVHDLGAMWRDWTGLPFVFALFATRRDFLEREPESVHRIHGALLAARDLARLEVDRVCELAARWEGHDVRRLERYYTEALDFGLGERQLAGIAEFARVLRKTEPGLPTDIGSLLLAAGPVGNRT